MKSTSIRSSAVPLSIVLLMVACQHEPMITPGSPLDNGGGGGGVEPEPTDTCDPNIVWFEQQVLPIFEQYCTMSGCHNTATDDNDWVQLTSYATITNPSHFNDIWDELQDGDMPPSGSVPLPQAEMNILFTWMQQGAQNNSCEGGCQMGSITYSGTIRPIIQDRCIGCHSGSNPQGGLNFSNWSGLNAVAADGRLALAIQHLPGASSMPPSGNRLSQCRIDQILAWIQAGAPNN